MLHLRCGGFLGGMSNGEELRMKVAVKPTPTISKVQDSINMAEMKEAKLEAITRRDITICPRIYPVAEAMVNIALLDALYMAHGYDAIARIDTKWKKMAEPRK